MIRTEILKRAENAVNGERDKQYGNPEDNFGLIARLWTVYKGEYFTAHDVAIMMALMKVGRIRTGPEHADSYIDLAGYAACAAEIATKGNTHGETLNVSDRVKG